MEVKVRLPAPARLLMLGEQSMLNELRFRWDREYRVDFNGHAWTAVSQTDDDIMRADTAPCSVTRSSATTPASLQGESDEAETRSTNRRPARP